MTIPVEDIQHILAHTAGLWDPLQGRRLFLTGGTGFFGCWLLESFTAANDAFSLGAEAVVLTRNPERFAAKAPQLANHPAVKLVQGDVADFAFPSGNFSHIIHAATTSGSPVSDEEMTRTIVAGTRRILDFAAVSGAQSLLLTSSGAVYGKQPSGLTHLPEKYEDNSFTPPPHPAYTLGKRVSEQLCLDAHRQTGLQTRIARCFAFVGPHLPLDAHFAIGNFLRDALKGSPIHVQGDGTPFRSYLYAADLAIWLWTILFRGQSARAYNVGSPHGLSIRELAQTIGSIYGVPVTIAKDPESDALPARYVPDTRRIEDELAVRVWIPLEDAIRRTGEWHQQAAR